MSEFDQEFRITVRLKAKVSTGIGEHKYLTEERVRRQVEKFLKMRSITEGLPCHGQSEFHVTDVIEEKSC